uniref:Putative aarF domain-containing protein kinase 1 n=1 Tax=Noccaea caerulescens TaxID=107243 RepID=A0A1J3ETW6_NOCCA
MHAIDFKEIQEKLADGFLPWQRSFQFWARTSDIYTGYKVFQLRVSFVKDVKKQEEMWERQHELAAHKIYSMCSDLGGFFLKAAQILGKPDLAPAAWVRKLVTLCDQAPATPFDAVRLVLEKELGQSIGQVFETFDDKPLGSASIAQVHRARVKGDKRDVVVKVQHPGVEKLMMTDIRNLQLFALFMQKTDVKFDLFSVTKEIEKQIGYEFDFKREANAMQKIRRFLYDNNRKSPVLVPRVLPHLVTRRILVMDYINGIPILRLGDEMAKRGINPRGKVAEAAKLKILSSLSQAYGQMILKSGFFHADPHPGNILICKGSEVALLDYGQVKELPDHLRLGYANLVIAIADNNASLASQSFRELGLVTFAKCENEQQELLQLAKTMFDTKMPPGVSVMEPFSEDSSIKKISVEAFPEELFSVLRTMILLRGLSVGIGLNYYSCAQQWKPIAQEALLASGRLSTGRRKQKRRCSSLRRLFPGD